MKIQDLNEISVFVAVAKTGGISKAGQELGLPKSTISRKLASLESRLGLTLMQRTTRKISLTRVGEEYYQTCAQALKEIEDAEKSALTSHEVPQGLLKISMPLEVADSLIKKIHRFSELHPLIQLEIDLSNRPVDLVREGFDLALRAGFIADQTLKAKKIAEGRFILVASPSYLNNNAKISNTKDLLQHRLIVFSGRRDPLKWKLHNHNNPKDKAAEISVAGHFTANSAKFCKKIAIEGGGVAFVPESLVQESLISGELMRVLPNWAGDKSPLHIVYPPAKRIPLRLRAFIDFISSIT